MNMRSQNSFRSSQNGVALFMSLAMLLIITVLGLSSVQTTTLQERMARNARDTNLAFQSAESAIKDGEEYIETFASLASFDGANENDNGLYYEAAYNAASNWSQVDWDAAEVGGGYILAPTVIDGVATQSKYIIEHVKGIVSETDRLNLENIGQSTGAGAAQIFRITVYGTGGSDTAHVMIQSTYGKRI